MENSYNILVVKSEEKMEQMGIKLKNENKFGLK
jgi:hypothetical protein